jgi:arylsulfatase A-like enzyme
MLGVLCLTLSVSIGCKTNKKIWITVDTEYNFIDHMNQMETEGRNSDPVKIQKLCIDREYRRIIKQFLDTRLIFKEVLIHEGAQLHVGLGMNPADRDKEGKRIKIDLLIKASENSEEKNVFSHSLDPFDQIESGKWNDKEIDLSDFAGKTVTVLFRASPAQVNTDLNTWIALSDPYILSSGRKIRITKPNEKNIILITADTLRADYLGCYGHGIVKTPVIDGLARQSVLFENCISQCNQTNPSHSSIFTSLYLKDHGVYDNSTILNEGVLTMAEIFKENGFRTVAVVSASHLNPDQSGFGQGFDDFYTWPGSNPSLKQLPPQRQAASTNRDVFSWIAKNYGERFFMWIHYFDPHALYIPPYPYNDMYYGRGKLVAQDKSEDEFFKNRFKLEQWIEKQFLLLKAGKGEKRFTERFIDLLQQNDVSSQFFTRSKDFFKKDFSSDNFALWLNENSAHLKNGQRPDAQFSSWLDLIIPLIEEKKNACTLLDPQYKDVDDINYPISQYMGEVSYLDEQIGLLLQRLKEFNLYDQTDIIFTADHGESMGEHGIYFTHRGLYESTLKIPLIIKAPKISRGTRIPDVVSSIDILPTLLELHDIRRDASFRGKSLVSLMTGKRSKLTENLSFSENANKFAISIRTEKYKFIKDLETVDYYSFLLGKPQFIAGRGHLYDLQSDPEEKEDLAESQPGLLERFDMEATAWLADRLRVPQPDKRKLDEETIKRLKALGYIK